MIKAIIFDVAGVMIELEDEKIICWAVKNYKVKREIFETAYNRVSVQYELNKINCKQFHERLFKAIKRPLFEGLK